MPRNAHRKRTTFLSHCLLGLLKQPDDLSAIWVRCSFLRAKIIQRQLVVVVAGETPENEVDEIKSQSFSCVLCPLSLWKECLFSGINTHNLVAFLFSAFHPLTMRGFRKLHWMISARKHAQFADVWLVVLEEKQWQWNEVRMLAAASLKGRCVTSQKTHCEVTIHRWVQGYLGFKRSLVWRKREGNEFWI